MIFWQFTCFLTAALFCRQWGTSLYSPAKFLHLHGPSCARPRVYDHYRYRRQLRQLCWYVFQKEKKKKQQADVGYFCLKQHDTRLTYPLNCVPLKDHMTFPDWNRFFNVTSQHFGSDKCSQSLSLIALCQRTYVLVRKICQHNRKHCHVFSTFEWTI